MQQNSNRSINFGCNWTLFHSGAQKRETSFVWPNGSLLLNKNVCVPINYLVGHIAVCHQSNMAAKLVSFLPRFLSYFKSWEKSY